MAPGSVDRTSTAAERALMWIAIALLVAYAGLVALLIAMRSDTHWDRLVFLLAGVEAIVFAAAGWLFGTTVQRGRVQDAHAALDDAKADADKARESADESQRGEKDALRQLDEANTAAERGAAFAAAVKAKNPTIVSTRLGARPEDAAPPSSDLAELLDLAHRLYPEADR